MADVEERDRAPCWTGIKEMDGEPIEGFYRSHQVPAREVKTKQYQLQLLEDWLRSYHIEELFAQGHPIAEILEVCPLRRSPHGLQSPYFWWTHPTTSEST